MKYEADKYLNNEGLTKMDNLIFVQSGLVLLIIIFIGIRIVHNILVAKKMSAAIFNVVLVTHVDDLIKSVIDTFSFVNYCLIMSYYLRKGL